MEFLISGFLKLLNIYASGYSDYHRVAREKEFLRGENDNFWLKLLVNIIFIVILFKYPSPLLNGYSNFVLIHGETGVQNRRRC